MATQQSTDRRPPPYAPYRSWKNLIEKLKEKRPLPHPFDSGFWNSLGFSGSMVNVLRPSMTALGLLDAQMAPTERLDRLLDADSSEIPAIYQEMLDFAFPGWEQRFDIGRVTSGQLTAYFSDLGVTGDTAAKCRSFFIGLATDAKLTLSPHLSTRSSTRKARSSAGQKQPNKEAEGQSTTGRKRNPPRQNPPPPPPASTGQEETVKLNSGGTITITLNANIWRLSADDEKFVLDIMHRMRDYKSVPNETEGPEPESIHQNGREDMVPDQNVNAHESH